MSSSSLEVPRRQRPEKRSQWWRVLVIVATVAVAVGWLIWFLRTPDDLPTSSGTVDDVGVVGQEVYIGMLAVGDDFERTINISDVEVDVTADGEVDVEPMLCRGGSVSVTTDAAPFCPELDPVEGAELSDGDSIVLVVSAAEPTEVEIGRIEISFREGIKWGTKAAGIDGATLTFVEHDPGTVVEDTEADESTSERPDQEDPTDREKKKERKDRTGNNA
ncbi:hypothetical protein [Nocardioides bizhenqiangii]|uniref:Uncharacterized protein n=1 Tax=Nocardioides bizhenqiangii TaxID=3095076 RepID=A0ABZ0ZVG3_9ACTN|nr:MULTISPECIES: hypothetical protein [unclassified Nocardioides]MDZ5623518.1 hypothetical protein [Nocardioides sp. HM23]WQQ28303.1 hypothetical protein SHK19_08740 [Nocardioides sp. HM61]